MVAYWRAPDASNGEVGSCDDIPVAASDCLGCGLLSARILPARRPGSLIGLGSALQRYAGLAGSETFRSSARLGTAKRSRTVPARAWAGVTTAVG